MSISKMIRCTRTWEAEQLSCRNHIWLDFDWPSNGHFSLSFLYLTYSFLLFVYPWFGRGFKSDQTQALAFEKIWLNSGSLFLLSASLLSIKVVFFTTHSRVSWWMVPISFWFWVKTQPSFLHDVCILRRIRSHFSWVATPMRLFEMFMHTNIQLLCDLQTHTGGPRNFETHCFSSNIGHAKRTSAICHKIAF